MVKMCQNVELIVKLWCFFMVSVEEILIETQLCTFDQISTWKNVFSWKDINEKVRFWSLKKYVPAEDVVPIYLGIWGMPYKKWGLPLEKRLITYVLGNKLWQIIDAHPILWSIETKVLDF